MTRARTVPVRAADVLELRRAWRAFNDDEGQYDRLARAVMRVLGNAETPEAKALREARPVSLYDLLRERS